MNVSFNNLILGFDLGTENYYICVPKEDSIGLVNIGDLNYTPVYINLSDNNREIGIKAKQNHNDNVEKTFYNLKNLIGKTYNEMIKDENLLFPIKQGPKGELLIQAFVFNNEHLLTPTQLLAMIFTDFKHKTKTSKIVINYPNYFTDCQKREILNAALIADLKIVKMIPDLTAIAFYYCLYTKNFVDKNNHNVVLVNIGSTSTQCSIINFDPIKNFFKVLVVEHDKNLGGRNFDEALVKYLYQENKMDSYKISKLNFKNECEKLKIQLSTKKECIMDIMIDDKNLSCKIKRDKFDELCKDYFDRIETVLQKAVNKLEKMRTEEIISSSDIDFVEVTGGSSKIPAIKNKIKSFFTNNPPIKFKTNDTIIGVGCTLQGKSLSSCFTVENKLKYEDYQPYQINVDCYHEFRNDLKKNSIKPLFKEGCTIPSTVQMKISCHELPMIFDVVYVDKDDKICQLGKFRINSKENITFPKSKMKIKFRIDENGIFQILSSQLEIKNIKENENSNESENNIDENFKVIDLNNEIIFLKGHIEDEKLDEFINFESSFEDQIDILKKLKKTFKDTNKKWHRFIKEEKFKKILDPELRNNFIEKLEENELWLSENDEQLLKKTDYLKRLNLVNSYIEKVESEDKENCKKKEISEQLDILIEATKNQDKGFLIENKEWFDESLKSTKNIEIDKDSEHSYKNLDKKLKELNTVILGLLKEKEYLKNL